MGEKLLKSNDGCIRKLRNIASAIYNDETSWY